MKPVSPSSPALLLIDLQRAIDDPSWGRRNQPEAESNIARLLTAWRVAGRPVLHVRHLSREPHSTYRPGQVGAEFKPGLEPLPGEPVFSKSTHSAFVGTGLEAWLRGQGIEELTLAGVITDNSVEATARMASDLGFVTQVVSDACFTFGRKDFAGVYRDADLIHALSLSRLNGEYACVLDTEAALAQLQATSTAPLIACSASDESSQVPPRHRRWREQELPAAIVVAVIESQRGNRRETLLLRRTQAPYAGLWALPGGKWEYGETLREAVMREAREETGLDTDFIAPLAVVAERMHPGEENAVGAHFLLHVCSLSALTDALKPSPEGELAWFDDLQLADLAAQKSIVPSDAAILTHCLAASGFAAFEADVAVNAQGETRLVKFARCA